MVMTEIPPEDHERLRSLAFNAVTRVTVEADRFVALTERRAIADRVLDDVLPEHEVMVRRQVTIENDAARQICPRCRFPEWMHDLWKCTPHHMPEFVGDDELRRDVVLRELNEGALSGMDSQVSERAVDLVLAALNRYDAWKASQDARIARGGEDEQSAKGMKVTPRHDDRAERMATDPEGYFAEARERARRNVRGGEDDDD